MIFSITRREACTLVISAGAAAILLFFPADCAGGIKNGMTYAVSIIVPSLFPYMVLSGFIMRSGADRIIGRLFAPVTRLLFNLPSDCAAAVILSMVGGFPVGAKPNT